MMMRLLDSLAVFSSAPLPRYLGALRGDVREGRVGSVDLKVEAEFLFPPAIMIVVFTPHQYPLVDKSADGSRIGPSLSGCPFLRFLLVY